MGLCDDVGFMISVLIVNYDGGEVLLRSLEELYRAGGFEEVVLADNGSTDGSAADVARRFPEVRILELGENLGFGAANNRAAEAARGNRLLLLNSDAWPEPGCLEALDAALDADPGLALVAPRLFYPDGRRQFSWAPTTSVLGEAVQMVRNRLEGRSWAHDLPRRLLGPGWYTAACLLLRRDAFEQVGGFDEGYFLYFEDVDLCVRLRRRGWRLAHVTGARAVHVKGGSQGPEGGAAGLEYRRSQLRYYRLRRPGWEQRLLRARLRRKRGRIEDPEIRRALVDLMDREERSRSRVETDPAE
ncbi:MAG: glycosyltransferase family 2 protein [Holophagales bacterium]|nr:glycosyltransferase family 2 protein [Holophagales bacterium]